MGTGKNLKAPRPSEHPPVKHVNLSYIHGVQRIRAVVTNRKIIIARREVGNKCRLYKHFVVGAKKYKGRYRNGDIVA